jgi:hypothetical protein
MLSSQPEKENKEEMQFFVYVGNAVISLEMH